MKTLTSPRPSVSVFPLLDLVHLLKKPLDALLHFTLDHQTTLRPLTLTLGQLELSPGGAGGPGQGGDTASQLPGPGPRCALPTQLPLATPGGDMGAPAQPTGCHPTPTHGGLRAGAVQTPASLCCRIPAASPDPLPPCGDSSIGFSAKETF